jgi:hypothetical protein
MKTQQQFLQTLQQRAQEQAAIEQSSPLPGIMRPFASIIGEYPWQVLLGVSFVFSLCISTVSYALVRHLYETGVLYWLISR